MHRKSLEEFAASGPVVRMNFQPGVDKRTDQPGPNRALMVRAVARTQIAAVNWFVIWIVGRKRAQTDRCDQFFFHDVKHRTPMFWIERRMIERDGEQLVRPTRRIVA